MSEGSIQKFLNMAYSFVDLSGLLAEICNLQCLGPPLTCIIYHFKCQELFDPHTLRHQNSTSNRNREAPVRFGSVTVRGWNGSSGSGFRFRRFLCKKGFSVFHYTLAGKDGSGSAFGSWENGSGGSGSAFGFGKNGSDGSGSRFRFGS